MKLLRQLYEARYSGGKYVDWVTNQLGHLEYEEELQLNSEEYETAKRQLTIALGKPKNVRDVDSGKVDAYYRWRIKAHDVYVHLFQMWSHKQEEMYKKTGCWGGLMVAEEKDLF